MKPFILGIPAGATAVRAVVAVALAGGIVAACSDDGPTFPRLSEEPPTPGAFNYTTIDVPGALATIPQGINRRGDIVGFYTDAGRVVRGFLLREGAFTTLDFPGAVLTQARGIGPEGEIVGTYRLSGEPPVNFHGFLWTPQAGFTKVDYPGHTSTMPQRILPDGTILGCRHDNDMTESMRGVEISRRGNRETDAFASMHNGATPDLRRIGGLYVNRSAGNRTEGYLIDQGEFIPLLVPGSILTAVWDVNSAGEVAGVYQNQGGFHGFVLASRGYLSVDAPSATATRAFGINAAGEVVGSFVDAGGRTHGFVARPGSR